MQIVKEIKPYFVFTGIEFNWLPCVVNGLQRLVHVSQACKLNDMLIVFFTADVKLYVSRIKPNQRLAQISESINSLSIQVSESIWSVEKKYRKIQPGNKTNLGANVLSSKCICPPPLQTYFQTWPWSDQTVYLIWGGFIDCTDPMGALFGHFQKQPRWLPLMITVAQYRLKQCFIC